MAPDAFGEPESGAAARPRERGRAPHGLFDEVERRGAALVLSGPAGISKSRLLEEGEALARERGMTVLGATGVESEAQLPFAGLHQLLRPIRGHGGDLLPGQRAALDAAFGLTEGTAPEPFVIAMAVLDLLSEVAGETSCAPRVSQAGAASPRPVTS